ILISKEKVILYRCPAPLALVGLSINVFSLMQKDAFYQNKIESVFLGFFIFYGGKVKLPAFFNTQKAQLPL
ncbi:TPA: hypothetical protein ACF9GP_002608, partial [Staphylococcus aureus]